ncbi:tetraspanin-33-like [Ornithodoros turicata]|uniref:tetraspanin-33-like n=1 Tax=Ornithodoros turicata TaxID=34597 RepID=UPI0031390141
MTVHGLLKYTIIVMNFIYWLLGGSLFLLGLYVFLVKERILRRCVDLTFDPAVVCMVIGLGAFCLASCGCIGALRENLRLLSIYRVCLVILFIITIFFTALIFLFSVANLKSYRIVERTLRRAIVIYRDDPDLEDFINAVQISLHCCGISSRGYLDWQLNQYFNCSELNYSRERCGVPYSCCKRSGALINVMCGYGVTDSARNSDVYRRIFTEGCLSALRRTLRENGVMLSSITGTVVGTLAVGITFVCLLMHSIKEIAESRVPGGRPQEVRSGQGHLSVSTL